MAFCSRDHSYAVKSKKKNCGPTLFPGGKEKQDWRIAIHPCHNISEIYSPVGFIIEQ